MNEQSIEFQHMEDPLSPKIMRKSFRIPVEPSDSMEVILEKSSYKILDISIDGISFMIDDGPVFAVDQSVSNCELKLGETVIQGLTGAIVHFSQNPGEEAGGSYGLKWIEPAPDQLKAISDIFSEIKKDYLSKTHSDDRIEEK